MTKLQLRLALTGLALSTAACIVDDDTMSTDPQGIAVTWTNLVGVSATGNSLGKTAGNGWGNAGAVSVATIWAGDGFVEFTTSETNRSKALGLSHGDGGADLADIDFAIELRNNKKLYIHEAGVLRGQFGTYSPGDVLRVELAGRVVRYLRNGEVLYTSRVAPTYPLLADTALGHLGATLTDVELIGPLIPRDPISGYAVPLTQGEWDLVFDAAGVRSKTVSQSWDLQDGGGDAVAAIGSPLVASAGTLALDYRQPVPGWARGAIMFAPDGTREFLKQTRVEGPDPAAESVLSFVYASVEPLTVVPSTRRVLVLTGSAGREVLLGLTNVGGIMYHRLVCAGIATLGAPTTAGTVRPIALQHDRTAARVRAYTDEEVITGAYSTAIINSTKGLGTADGSGTTGVQRNLLAATFRGADAEWTEAEMRAVYNVLIDRQVAW